MAKILKHQLCRATLILLLVGLCGSPSTAREKLHFVCSIPQDHREYIELSKGYRAIFDRLDIDFSMQHAPLLRSIALIESGQADGGCVHSMALYKENRTQNIMPVDVILIKVDLQLWSHTKGISVNPNTELHQLGSKAGYKRGAIVVEDYLNKQKHLTIQSVETDELGLKMLAAKRLDFYIGNEIQINEAINNIDAGEKVYFAGNVATINLSPSLNIRHKDLAIPLAREIKKELSEPRTTNPK